jgi:hypothetical protein
MNAITTTATPATTVPFAWIEVTPDGPTPTDGDLDLGAALAASHVEARSHTILLWAQCSLAVALGLGTVLFAVLT